jgi:HEAT repeat protein
MLILPFRLPSVSEQELPWFLQGRYSPTITPDFNGISMIVEDTRNALARRYKDGQTEIPDKNHFHKDEQIEELLKDITIGDWTASEKAALKMNAVTKENGHNELFEPLLRYLDSPDEDQRWQAIQTLECFAELAPTLFSSELLCKFVNNQDFSIRSMAAVICYKLALSAPELVPINLLVKLSRHNEDWYVCTPANGALKTLARWRSTILRIFLIRITHENSYARELAANAIYDISEKEPEILKPRDLEMTCAYLSKIGDKTALDLIKKAMINSLGSRFGAHYKYSSF